MNREQYLQMRKTNQIDIGLFYLYYIKECEKRDLKPVPRQVFMQTFRIYFQQNSDQILEHFDNEFELTFVIDEDGDMRQVS